jgi:hypothetical protein
MELYFRIRPDRGGGVRNFQEVVSDLALNPELAMLPDISGKDTHDRT